MTRDEAMAALHEIVRGIDQTEDDSDGGWWETSTGAEFGARALNDLEDLIRRLAVT